MESYDRPHPKETLSQKKEEVVDSPRLKGTRLIEEVVENSDTSCLEGTRHEEEEVESHDSPRPEASRQRGRSIRRICGEP